MTKILFLHGFGSNGSSCKAGVLRRRASVSMFRVPEPPGKTARLPGLVTVAGQLI